MTEKVIRIRKSSLKQFCFGAGIAIIIAIAIGLSSATFYAGSSDINMQGSKITSHDTPSASTDAATKAYVDSAGPSFRGITDTSINGNQGGWKNANAICDGNYSGSHLCSVSELIKTGTTTTIASNSWVYDDLGPTYASYSSLEAYTQGQVFGIGESYVDTTSSNYYLYKNCGGFTLSTSSYRGTILTTSGSFYDSTCNSIERFACCGG